NPTSDDSALCVLDVQTGEEVCALAGKVQPEVLADYAVRLALWYNRAACLIERNNHGHAVLLAMRGHGVRLLDGKDGRPGWLSSTLGNTELYDRCADAVRNGEVQIHALATFTQLAGLDGNTLSAPPGQHDDRCLAVGTMVETVSGSKAIETIVPGEWVLTRQGYRRVLRAGMSHPREPIWEVTLANGSVLRGTADHPVWICGRGFTTIDAIALTDIMLSCESKLLNSTALSSGAIPIPGGETIGYTSLPTSRIGSLPFGCTARFGKRLTGQSLKGISFTTGTATRSTTRLRTLSASLAQGTPRNTSSAAITLIPGTEKFWTPSDPLLWSGTEARKVRPGTANTASGPGPGASPLPGSVSNAAPHLRRCGTGHVFARVPVSSVRPTGASGAVFNLTVEGAPEFFAAGVLVHNSDAFALANAGRPKANPPLPPPQSPASRNILDRTRAGEVLKYGLP
ncbi:MAG TPA: hypothetical protein VKD72_15050, partial [Gemmataceae bacterium]|nr:hypothetical protein [Gemmataceae bacterium]